MLDVAAIREEAERRRLVDKFGLLGAKLARPELFGAPLLLGFVQRFGHVQYRNIRTGDHLWLLTATMSACEIDPDHRQEERKVFDHCHEHGWVRGMLCQRHNLQLGHIEAVMKISGVTVDLGTSSYASYLRLCPDCSGAEIISSPLATASELQARLLQ